MCAAPTPQLLLGSSKDRLVYVDEGSGCENLTLKISDNIIASHIK